MSGPDGSGSGRLADARRHLQADCSRCVGLCCVVPAFAASADFAIDKPARTPCPNLLSDHRCGIHDRLRAEGFPGCVVFDCFGAGQQVVEVTFGGRPPDPASHAAVGEAFRVMRQLHEMLFHLAEAAVLVADRPLADDVAALREYVDGLTRLGADALARLDPGVERRRVGAVLGRVGVAVRGGPPGPDHTGADLVGAQLRHLRGASLRGALLLGADLRGADLHHADLLGADLRGADLRAARLATALFLTAPQLEAARGDSATTVPRSLRRPIHWARERGATA